MEALEAIMTRRSIRQYTAQTVPDGHIETLLRAAMSAPSASNGQPWEFIVVADRAALNHVAAIHPHCQMAKMAQIGILICARSGGQAEPGYWPQDCAAAIENMLVAARALGLGAVWTGIYPRQERMAAFQKAFGIPDGITPVAMVPIGYPAEDPEPVDRFDTARIHHDRW